MIKFLKDEYIIRIDIEFEYKKVNNYKDYMPCLRVRGDINSDTSGQCFEAINNILKGHKTWDIIYRIWKKYHLNDSHAGTQKQEKILKQKNKKLLYADNYKQACKYLEEQNLLYDGGYKYGSSWLYQPIPEYTLKRIKDILKKYNNKTIKL